MPSREERGPYGAGNQGCDFVAKRRRHGTVKAEPRQPRVPGDPSGPSFRTLVLRKASYNVKNSIFGDKTGYGKTSTMIGLIVSTLKESCKPPPPMPLFDRGNFSPAKGTLIIVPSNFFDQ